MGVRAVFLVGFMGSGKSRVGQELARRLGWDFVDLDTRIETREGMTVPEIFLARGEPGFRLAETAALGELTDSLQCESVVALGGGTFVQEKNRALLRDWPVVFLAAPVEELWRRCGEGAEVRPLRQNIEQFTQLYAKRLPFYQQATATVETSGKDPAALCAEIEAALELKTG